MYTKKMHIHNLKQLMLKRNLHTKCPVTQNVRLRNNKNSYVCDICRDFIDIPKTIHDCPCRILGKDRAIKLTLQKLEESGNPLDICTCSNAIYGQECTCGHIMKYPGEITFKCRKHGIYKAGVEMCSECKRI